MFGILPNFSAVSGGAHAKPPGWKTDFELSNHQAFDYTSLGWTFLNSGIAYAKDSHPLLSTENGGDAVYWAYLWRGFLDRTDQVYQGSLLFPALLHQDTRYFALGKGPALKRTLHAVDSVIIARNYDGKPVFNAAGLLGKAGAQAVSKTYYPAGSEGFDVLAEKFAFACMRQAVYGILREFSPDIADHLRRRHATAGATPKP